MSLNALISRTRRPATRGQALVEMAIILPVLVLLLVLAIDFGRVFFGWVGLHNASRIAANEAARHPGAWDATPDADQQARYLELIERDLEAINCAVDSDGDGDVADDLPDPVFTDRRGTADPYEIGDLVQVDLTCDFQFITPITGMIMGNPLTITAGSHFAVFGGTINGIPVGAAPPATECLDAEVPNMVGLTVAIARDQWVDAGFGSAAFSPDASAGVDDETVTAQSTSPASNPGDCLVTTATVTVTSQPVEVCTAPEIPVPNLIGRTVANARDVWDDDFTGNFSPASGFDAEVVESQTLTGCGEPDADITVTHGIPPPPPPPMCDMPQMVNQKISAAIADWTTEGFDPANFTALPGSPADYKIGWQSLVGGDEYQCTSSVTVAKQEPAP